MNLLYPKFSLRFLGLMLRVGLVGAVIAGFYGIIHDQVTFSISREYFTQLKFVQFDYADFGFHERILVGEIGFLATWWVGFFGGWFIARVTAPVLSPHLVWRYCLIGFAIIFLPALAGGLGGYFFGLFYTPDYSYWLAITAALNVVQAHEFIRVAYIHNASYLGALIGIIAAVGYVFKKRRSAIS